MNNTIFGKMHEGNLSFSFATVIQALLDVYKMKREIGRLDGIKLGLVGDLANGRTVRSLACLIAMYPDIKICFVSPDVVKMKVQ
jgi:aspartate carbamoyltransferase catalytic subunit